MTKSLPCVGVEVGPALPGWALRVAAALMPALLIAVALLRTPLTAPPRSATDVALVLAAVAALALGTLWRPGAWQPILAVLAAAGMLALSPDGRWWSLVLAPLGYLAFRLAVLAAAVPWGARVERAVLARAARTDLLVVAVTAVIGCLGLVLDGDRPAGLVLGSFAVLALAWWVRRTA